MPLPNAPLIRLDVPENRLVQPGFVRRYHPSDEAVWPRVAVSQTGGGADVYAWPGVRMVTLAPIYDPNPAEMTFANWTTSGTNAAWSGPRGFADARSECVFQCNPAATGMTVTANFTPDDNQPFYADFYLHAVYDASWYADLLFCRNYCIRFLYNGSVQLWRDESLPGQTANWRYLTAFKNSVNKIRNQLLRLAVYPTGHQEMLLMLTNCEPLTVSHPNPVVVQDEIDPTDAVRVIADAAPPR